ncbi:MAG: hypothetical protein A2428_02660 [Bdellovibrionales bacterium RIFOXYC1_FULL_54_43]|nr:MAG: hypothetical protein A2428_02660 [Bdellovibrionales bacterium RIFOXYC1_FULL_54_43]OFZ79547.1 MAG: hypothetical protein A2603_12960 [Bdellovibrionales bacterium RIFOXYD1_FULL_55_31]
MSRTFVVLPILFPISIALSACGSPEAREPAASVEALRVPERDPELMQVTRIYGDLFVHEGEFEAESAVKPWSSWWYPTKDTYLFQKRGDELSPLEKYDRLMRSRNLKATAAAFERDHLYDPNASAWEGLCNAWAIASLMEPEPTLPVRLGDIMFHVGDTKALIVKTYESIESLQAFGQRYNGGRTSEFDDLYPEQFHRILQAELFERGRPFIMDKDPGVPVWNTPVWKTQLQIVKDPSDPRVAHVTAWVVGASPFVESYDFVGTLSVVFQYTYDLYGYPQNDGSLRVVYGDWTGESRDYHPDFVTTLPDEKKRKSFNSELDPAVVDELLRFASKKN